MRFVRGVCDLGIDNCEDFVDARLGVEVRIMREGTGKDCLTTLAEMMSRTREREKWRRWQSVFLAGTSLGELPPTTAYLGATSLLLLLPLPLLGYALDLLGHLKRNALGNAAPRAVSAADQLHARKGVGPLAAVQLVL